MCTSASQDDPHLRQLETAHQKDRRLTCRKLEVVIDLFQGYRLLSSLQEVAGADDLEVGKIIALRFHHSELACGDGEMVEHLIAVSLLLQGEWVSETTASLTPEAPFSTPVYDPKDTDTYT